jgi:hypothetical protein
LNKIKKITVILILVLITLPATNVIGTIIQEEKNKTIPLEYSIFKEDGSQIIKQIFVDENEIASFIEIIEYIFENITSADNLNIITIIQHLNEKFNQNTILSTISGIRPLQKRVLIISDGYGPKLDIQLKGDISLHKTFSLWYYLGTTSCTKNSKTIIIDPITVNPSQFYRLIQGQQIGIMTRFIGFYMRIPGSLMEQQQSHTFFFGYAVKVRAFDLPDMY